MKREQIEALLQVAEEHNLTKVRVEIDKFEIAFERRASKRKEEATRQVKQAVVASEKAETVVRSHLVGYFRRLPDVLPGGKVNTDTVVGIVEALGLSNELHAGVVGTIDDILVEDGQPVQYGQPIMRIET